MKRVIEKALKLLNNINNETGYEDSDITSGIRRLNTDDRKVFMPQTQLVYNSDDEDGISNIEDYITELQYIESTGTQYISTRLQATPNTHIVIDMQFTQAVGSDHSFLLGSNEQSSTSSSNTKFGFGFGWDYTPSTGHFITNINDANHYAWTDAGFGDTNRHVWDLKSGSQKIDNVEYSTTTISSNKTTDMYFYLFARRASWNGGATEFCPMKLYSCQMYDGETLIRDFVPAYNSYLMLNGLFDRVEKVFYPNLRTETGYTDDFIAGPIAA